jgi:hypothetical protein
LHLLVIFPGDEKLILKTNHYRSASTCLKIPPPATRPHLIIFLIRAVTIVVYSMRCVTLLVLKSWIADQFLYALHRIAMPQFNVLSSK